MSSYLVFLLKYDELFINGFIMTIKLSVIASLIGLILGTMTALAKLSHRSIFRWPANIYIEIFRGTPLLVQILFMSYAYPFAIRDITGETAEVGTWANPSTLWDCIIALSLNTGAYQAEIIRAGIQGIPSGQMEAARGVGLTYPQSMKNVILPQAFRMITPPLAGEFINLILNSSLVAVVALQDLTFQGRTIQTLSIKTLETWFTVGALYFILTFSLSNLFRHFEQKYKIPGLGQV
ncbi:MAG: amino acid ABC transporter permease [Candidatus Kariarchaeaceae archaeon]